MTNLRVLAAAAAGFLAGCILTHLASLHPTTPRTAPPEPAASIASRTLRSRFNPAPTALVNAMSTPAAARRSPQTFPDVPPDHWAYTAVEGLVRRRILSRQAHNRFAGEQPVTRFEMALALYRMVRYLEPSHAAAPPAAGRSPAAWLVSNNYLLADTLLARPPSSASVSPPLLSESLAYVSDRILLHRAPPDAHNEQNQ